MRTLFVVSLLLALTLAGCSSSDSNSTSSGPTSGATTSPTMNMTAMTYQVSIAGSKFVNGTLSVHVGDTVKWTHADGNTPHTVTADDGSFDSSPQCAPAGGVGVPLGQVCMVNGSTFEQKFTKAGTFAYHCKVHASMTGTITVTAMMMM
ncbi:MAG: plastocyanin/azurin family copper-binding protein [Thermoplasmatota archaeon]